jgi:hypothetical protein
MLNNTYFVWQLLGVIKKIGRQKPAKHDPKK